MKKLLNPLEIGQTLWQQLHESFLHIMIANNVVTEAQKSQMWAGFLASFSGAMAADVGIENADLLLRATLQTLNKELINNLAVEIKNSIATIN